MLKEADQANCEHEYVTVPAVDQPAQNLEKQKESTVRSVTMLKKNR